MMSYKTITELKFVHLRHSRGTVYTGRVREPPKVFCQFLRNGLEFQHKSFQGYDL